MNSTTVKFKFDGNDLVPETAGDALKLANFKRNLKVGSGAELFISETNEGNEKTLPQLARVHAMIKELAGFTGYTFSEMKKLVKSRSGLTFINDKGDTELKSFADCTKIEVASAIEACIDIGMSVDYIFPK